MASSLRSPQLSWQSFYISLVSCLSHPRGGVFRTSLHSASPTSFLPKEDHAPVTELTDAGRVTSSPLPSRVYTLPCLCPPPHPSSLSQCCRVSCSEFVFPLSSGSHFHPYPLRLGYLSIPSHPWFSVLLLHWHLSNTAARSNLTPTCKE